jgi:16S rRNA (uracil1498-N3)-methyltransferase
MSSHRFLFYSPEAESGDASIVLTGDEHHHLSHVLRIATGEVVFVTNGRGVIATCRVESVAATSSTLAVSSVDVKHDSGNVTLALALLKKDRFARAFEQCVELGVARVLPFVAQRSHVKRYGPGTMARLRRIAVSAMKQSFRACLPEIMDPVEFDAVVGAATAADSVVVGDRDARGVAVRADAGAVLAVVGPEAGLAPSELDALLGAGARLASVSRHRLRAETAAAVLVAALQHGD